VKQGRDSSVFLSAENAASPSNSTVGEPGPASWKRWTRPGEFIHDEKGGTNRRNWFLTLGLLVSVAALLVATGWLNTARDWLAARPEYQVRWSEVKLEPAPPDYIRSGSAGVLAGVRKRLGNRESISSLGQAWSELAHAIPLGSPWVEEVKSIVVSSYPNQLKIELVYRQPVAVLNVPGNTGGKIVLDRQGVVLPIDDVDLKRAGSLIRIDGLSGPLEPRPGLTLVSSGSPDEPRLEAALKLTNFAMSQSESHSTQPEPSLLQAVNLRYGNRQIFAQTRDGLWVLWGDAPDLEPAGSLNALQKWNFLRDWLANHAPVADRPGSYLVFTTNGAALQAGKGTGGGAGRRSGPSDSGE